MRSNSLYSCRHLQDGRTLSKKKKKSEREEEESDSTDNN